MLLLNESGRGHSIPNYNSHESFYLFIPRGSFAKTFITSGFAISTLVALEGDPMEEYGQRTD